MRAPQTQASHLLFLFHCLAFHDLSVILNPLVRSRSTSIQGLEESSLSAKEDIKIALRSHLVELEDVKV